MTVVAHGTGRVPVTGYQVVLAPAGHPFTLVHPQADRLMVAEPDQLALACAGTEMLTTLVVRVHDTAPTDAAAATEARDAVMETLEWVVTDAGELLAYADDYGATAIPEVTVPAGRWRVRGAVTGRAAAAQLDEQLIAADEAGYDHPDANREDGPVLGPEVWRLDLWPAR
jgi:hypothetical protein